jgi:hypothetical protein
MLVGTEDLVPGRTVLSPTVRPTLCFRPVGPSGARVAGAGERSPQAYSRDVLP